jgi:branched-chain amino acid transport system permease protein
MLKRWGVWIVFAAVLLVAPLAWTSSLGQTMLSQMGIAIIACLAYNILLGQGGMLSFGHAVYSGLGAYCAVHVLNLIGAGQWALPVSLVPLVGGVCSLGFASLIGYVTTRKSGTTFAMITLGIGELVASMSLMFPDFFGGEGGISTNRVVGKPVLGISFGPQIQVYYLIALYCFACTALMYALTRTPLGRMLNAVRDNPERVEFIGYSAQRIRYLAFMISAFFAGIAGGLGAINFELVTGEVVSNVRSGAYLLFVFLGGVGFFFGPIIGAVLMVVATVLLSEWTKAWLLYLGLAFLVMVMAAPGGLASIVMQQRALARQGLLKRLLPVYGALIGTAAVGLLGTSAAIEMVYHLQLNEALGPQMRFAGLPLNVRSGCCWAIVAGAIAAGLVSFGFARRWFHARWAALHNA